MTIFVSIAAYRDPELVPTIKDCIAKARWPDDLRFGVCWQHGEGEDPPPRMAKKRMRLIDVPWRESQGACWARAEIMKLYDGEDWFLQLDSHHRFFQDWDALLLEQAERSGSALPVIGSYGAPYDPTTADAITAVRRCITVHHFAEDGLPIFHGPALPLDTPFDRPRRARFIAAGTLFAPGRFVADIPYDPELYFQGEEITLSIRAFTRGYDLFHPSRHIIWHEILPARHIKHWDDHLTERGIAMPWQTRDAVGRGKAAQFLSSPYIGLFGCGTERSFADYEAYAGMNFLRRYASVAAQRGDEPEPPHAPLRDFCIRIAVNRAALPQAALDRPQFWYVGFHDASGAELARHDAASHELQRAMLGDHVVIERRFSAPCPPTRWTVWPTDRRGRWLEAISGPVDTALTS